MKKFIAATLAAGILFSGYSTEFPKLQESPKGIEFNLGAKRAEAAVVNLGMTADQFIQKYNYLVKSYGLSSIYIGETKNKYGEQLNTFQYLFNPNVAIIGSSEKSSGLLREVFILATPKTDVEAMMTLAAYGGITMTLSPELDSAQRQALMRKLKISGDNIVELKNGNGVAVVGNVKYTTQLINGMFNFIASAKDL